MKSKSWKERGYWILSAHVSRDPEGEEALKHSDYLNAKTSALLTHVTLMIAITLWFLNREEKSIYINGPFSVEGSVAIELLCYVIVTLFCIRAIFVTTERTFKNILSDRKAYFSDEEIMDAVVIFTREVEKRKLFFSIATIGTIFTTIAFSVSLVCKFML